MAIRLGLSVLTLALLSSVAFAADPVQPQPEASDDWAGFYSGFNIGYGMGTTKLSTPGGSYDGTGSEGANGGVFAGHNWQFEDVWVAGLEIGGSLSDLNGHTDLVQGSDYAHLETRNDWSVGVSARLGKLVSPDTLIYGGLGAKTYHGVGSFESSNSAPQSEDDMFTAVGVMSVGVETQLGGNWRLRGQYDAELMNYNIYEDTLLVQPRLGTATASLIYDMDGAGEAPEVTADADKWTGFYAGIVGGQSAGVSALHIWDDPDYFRYDGFGSHGVTGGVVGGATMRVGERFVVGGELGGFASTLRTFIGSEDSQDGLLGINDRWVGAKARAGYLASDNTMLYGFAGISRVNSNIAQKVDGDIVMTGEAEERNAVTAGVGIETWISDNLTMRGEYEYAQLANLGSDGSDPSGLAFEQNQQTATVGVFYHFGK